MSAVRFQVGVPRAGDAARSAESSPSPMEDGWTRAKKVALPGSAARAAEERKRAEAGDSSQGKKTIALRATGGAVVDRDTMVRHDGMSHETAHTETSSRENLVTTPGFPGEERITSPHVVSADTVSGSLARPRTEDGMEDEQDTPGVLQSAANHLQALTRSLFQRRNVTANNTRRPRE